MNIQRDAATAQESIIIVVYFVRWWFRFLNQVRIVLSF